MKCIVAVLALFFSVTLSAQEVIFNQNFEKLPEGKQLLEQGKDRFFSWYDDTSWEVVSGDGADEGKKFAVSSTNQQVNIVQYADLVAGETYVFSVDVKIDNQGVAWKRNYSIGISSGKKGDSHSYKNEKIEMPVEGKWESHSFKFKVKEGREKISFQVGRWAEGGVLCVDNFKIVKM
ncbi:hypothetical protein KH5_15330 [Urechidicola sp. KH5]